MGDIFHGHWKNTFADTKAIQTINIFKEEEEFFIEVTGAPDGYLPGEWGRERILLHCAGPDSDKAVGFQTTYEIHDTEVFLSTNINVGLIIIAGFFRPLDHKKGNPYYYREFFHQKKE